MSAPPPPPHAPAAVEHAQLEGASHPFKAFVRTLQDDERRVDELESGIASVLVRLSTLELKRRSGLRNIVYTQSEVDNLLRAAYRLRALWATTSTVEINKVTLRLKFNETMTVRLLSSRL